MCVESDKLISAIGSSSATEIIMDEIKSQRNPIVKTQLELFNIFTLKTSQKDISGDEMLKIMDFDKRLGLQIEPEDEIKLAQFRDKSFISILESLSATNISLKFITEYIQCISSNQDYQELYRKYIKLDNFQWLKSFDPVIVMCPLDV